jgi:hypothetical protein
MTTYILSERVRMRILTMIPYAVLYMHSAISGRLAPDVAYG